MNAEEGELIPREARFRLIGAALGDDPALVEQDDGVGQPVGFLQVLGGEQDGYAIFNKVSNGLPLSDSTISCER